MPPSEPHPHFRERPSCEACGAGGARPLYASSFDHPEVRRFVETYYDGRVDQAWLAGAPFVLAQCQGCGFVWQRWVLRDEGLGLLYEHWIDPAASREKRDTKPLATSLAYARDLAHVASLVGKPPSQIAVLDHGMGWGAWCRMALAFGFRAAGTELSEARQAHARSLGIEVVTLDALPPHAFDFVHSEQSFEHIPEPRACLEKLAAALRPGGFVRVAVPDAGPELRGLLEGAYRPAKGAFQPLEHINAFTHASLEALGRRAGLEPVVRPWFPLVAPDARSLVRSLLSPLRSRFAGTSLTFRKPAR
jgi:SAM-dependent methyltransferase